MAKQKNKKNRKKLFIVLIVVALAFSVIWFIIAINLQRVNEDVTITSGEAPTETEATITKVTRAETSVESVNVPITETSANTVVFSTEDYSEPEVDVIIDNDLSIVASHRYKEYDLAYYGSLYKSAYFSVLLKDVSRDVILTINTDIRNVSVATSFITENGKMCEFGEFSNVSFENSENGTEIHYSIPDNPFGIDYSTSGVGFCGVFRIEIGDKVIYTAISY